MSGCYGEPNGAPHAAAHKRIGDRSDASSAIFAGRIGRRTGAAERIPYTAPLLLEHRLDRSNSRSAARVGLSGEASSASYGAETKSALTVRRRITRGF